MKKVIILMFLFCGIVISSPLFIEETPIKRYIKKKILKEAEEKGDIKTIEELTNENDVIISNRVSLITNTYVITNDNLLVITNYSIITNNNVLIITNDIDFSKYINRGYDITMDILPRYYTVREGDTLLKISSYPFIYGERNFGILYIFITKILYMIQRNLR